MLEFHFVHYSLGVFFVSLSNAQALMTYRTFWACIDIFKQLFLIIVLILTIKVGVIYFCLTMIVAFLTDYCLALFTFSSNWPARYHITAFAEDGINKLPALNYFFRIYHSRKLISLHQMFSYFLISNFEMLEFHIFSQIKYWIILIFNISLDQDGLN